MGNAAEDEEGESDDARADDVLFERERLAAAALAVAAAVHGRIQLLENLGRDAPEDPLPRHAHPTPALLVQRHLVRSLLEQLPAVHAVRRGHLPRVEALVLVPNPGVILDPRQPVPQPPRQHRHVLGGEGLGDEHEGLDVAGHRAQRLSAVER